MECDAILTGETEELEELTDDAFMYVDIEPPDSTDLQKQHLMTYNGGGMVEPAPMYDSYIEFDEEAY